MGTISSVIFAVRNGKKAIDGDKGRIPVAGCQLLSSVDKGSSALFSSITKGTGSLFSKADGAVEAVFKGIGGKGGEEALNEIAKTTQASSKIGAIAQKAVNPLLCAASGIRILKDDDQYAALIEETSAMGAMFGAEGLIKYARNAITGNAQAKKGFAGFVAKSADNSKTIKNISDKASKWFKNLGKGEHGKGKQLVAKIGLDALFVAGSVCAFNLGHKLGTVLSHRNNSEENKE